jgi:4a-hydroxytetrahydrobiopterin dehydratase
MTESIGLSRPEASAAVEALGWRHLLGTFCTSVPVSSLDEAVRLAARAAEVCGPGSEGADGHLRVDLRPDRLELTLQTAAEAQVTSRDVELAEAITAALDSRTEGAVSGPRGRSVQTWEVAIDAMDIPAILPFWRAVMAYVEEKDSDDALVDPMRQGPTIWFQQMDKPRPQRNRIHFDITVSHDEAEARVAAALDAGGHLVSDGRARAFWVLADREGNEVCVCTWQDREA